LYQQQEKRNIALGNEKKTTTTQKQQRLLYLCCLKFSLVKERVNKKSYLYQREGKRNITFGYWQENDKTTTLVSLM